MFTSSTKYRSKDALAPLKQSRYLTVLGGFKDGTKTVSSEDAFRVLREIDQHVHDGPDVMSFRIKAGISDETYHY